MKKHGSIMTYQFTAYIEKDPESGLFIGYIPSLPGAHSQGATLDELYLNLKEVTILCLEMLSEEELLDLPSQFIGTQELHVEV